jgi:hypothetical protein
MVANGDTKQCVMCGETKSITDFYKNKRAKDGACSYCKKCNTKYNTAYRNNRLKQDPSYRETIRAYVRKSDRKNCQKRIQTQVCELIKEHHEDMKDDPEHLTTEFLKSLLRVDCNGN